MNNIFDNTTNAFSLKNNAELNRAYLLFKMIGNPTLVKIGTSLTNFALKLHLPVQGIIRKTVFDHFCGGVSEQDCLKVVDKLYTKGVSSVLDYSVEGKAEEKQFDACMQMTIKTIDFAKNSNAIPFAVFKPTGVGSIEIYEKVGKKEVLSETENISWQKTLQRFQTICQHSFDNKVKLLIDGEETWMQDAADDVVANMMEKYNKESVFIYNTLQLYRWDRVDYLKKLHQVAKEKGFKIGMKLVRGAYMEKEAKRAEKLGYKNPICESKTATDNNFNAGLQYMLENLNDMAIFVGTHNEDSTYKTIHFIANNNLNKNDDRIWFGQLYGMSDNISFNLAANGFNVAKYLPFGPVKDVMPYLIRRAQENTSVAGQTGRELNLIISERNRRKIK
jgi:proline dehydrogenase